MDEVLMLHGGGAGMVSFLARVTGIDATAMVRLRQLTDGSDGQAPVVDVFATTPFEVVAARRLQGVISRDGAVVGADTMLEALNSTDFAATSSDRSEEHTSELQSRGHLVCRLLLEKKHFNKSHQ